MSNYEMNLLIAESSKNHLEERIRWLLDLMDKEHKHAATHSQRNAYQAVIRIELELLVSDLQRAHTRVAGNGDGADWIPF